MERGEPVGGLTSFDVNRLALASPTFRDLMQEVVYARYKAPLYTTAPALMDQARRDIAIADITDDQRRHLLAVLDGEVIPPRS